MFLTFSLNIRLHCGVSHTSILKIYNELTHTDFLPIIPNSYMMKLIFFLYKLEFFPHEQRIINCWSDLTSTQILLLWYRTFLRWFYYQSAFISSFFRGGQKQALFSSMANSLVLLAQKRYPTKDVRKTHSKP